MQGDESLMRKNGKPTFLVKEVSPSLSDIGMQIPRLTAAFQSPHSRSAGVRIPCLESIDLKLRLVPGIYFPKTKDRPSLIDALLVGRTISATVTTLSAESMPNLFKANLCRIEVVVRNRIDISGLTPLDTPRSMRQVIEAGEKAIFYCNCDADCGELVIGKDLPAIPPIRDLQAVTAPSGDYYELILYPD